MPGELVWMIERYPIDSRDVDPAEPTMLIVVMPVVSEQWLERLVLRLGQRAVVVAPERWTSLAARAARAVLDRYESTSRDN